MNDNRARVDEDRADLFTPYWMYLENGARHRSLSIIATHSSLYSAVGNSCEAHRKHSQSCVVRARVFLRAVVPRLLRNVFQHSSPSPPPSPSPIPCRPFVELSPVRSTGVNHQFPRKWVASPRRPFHPAFIRREVPFPGSRLTLSPFRQMDRTFNSTVR